MSQNNQVEDSRDLVAEFLANGGQVTKCPTKLARDGGGREFAGSKLAVKELRSGSKKN